MPTKEEKEVFDQMKECIPEIKVIKEENPSGIVFEYNGNKYLIKSEPQQGVIVTLYVLPRISSGVFTKEIVIDEDWNFNLADVDKDNKGTERCSFPLTPENKSKLMDYLDKLAKNNKS